MTPEAARAALAWLVEMGAGEVIQETAVDRFAAPLPRADPPPLSLSPSPPPMQRPAAIPAARPVAAAPAPAVSPATLAGLDDIKAALMAFDACPLKRTATNLVFSDGNPQAHVMFIGEAPGREEDLEGRPFVGKSGQLLDLMLSHIGMSRTSGDPATSCFITNMVYWRPPGNRTPTEQEMAMCLPFVRRAIEIIRPRIIVTLGKISTEKLLGRSDGILKLRGQWFEFECAGETIPLLATLHPAYLLRQPGQKRLAWRDLLALRKRMAG